MCCLHGILVADVMWEYSVLEARFVRRALLSQGPSIPFFFAFFFDLGRKQFPHLLPPYLLPPNPIPTFRCLLPPIRGLAGWLTLPLTYLRRPLDPPPPHTLNPPTAHKLPSFFYSYDRLREKQDGMRIGRGIASRISFLE